MQIFMTNIAFAATDMDIRMALASVLHRPPFPTDPVVNFDVELFKDRKGRPLGMLTLPETATGRTFLQLYGTGRISVKGRLISFSVSNKQRDGPIQRVRASTWEDPKLLQERKKKMENMSQPIALDEFSFGRFCRDSTFSAEASIGGTCTIACDMDLRQVRLVVTPAKEKMKHTPLYESLFGIDFSELSPQTTISASYSPSQIIAMAASTGPFLVFLESDGPPVFGINKTNIFSDGRTRPERLAFITEGRTMPPVCQHLCLTFSSRHGLETFVERSKVLNLPRPRLLESDILLVTRGLYSEHKMVKLDKFIGGLEFGLAFEVEKAVSTGVLEPGDLLETLKRDILLLQDDHQLRAGAIFRYFVGTLQMPSLVHNTGQRERRRGKRRRRGHRGPNRPDTSQPSNLVGQLKEAISAYLEDVFRPRNRYSVTPAIFQSYHLIVTPSKRVLEGPLPDQSNSVLRRFGHHESFLRVSFQDENGSKLRRDPNLDITDLLRTRFRPLLIDGCRLAGRRFEFLGYSMSGLKEYSLWFITPFKDDDNLIMNASRIRDKLGDFTKLLKKPARLAARWAQAFSASDPSDTLASKEIKEIEDRESISGSCFTDGCGTISGELSRAVWSKLQRARRRTSRSNVPSCFQIRLGGAKGVVVQDPRLSGRVICIRPSQIKFDAPNVRTLDITATSARPIPMFLNRPLICLLEHHGVPQASLIDLQDTAIQQVLTIHDSFSEASKLFSQHGLGASFRLPSLFKNILKQLELEVENPAHSPTGRLLHELIENCLVYASTHVLREIKYRAHIPVPNAVTLIGVSDEWGCLREGEIYATVHDARTSRYEAIEGRVLITRSPQIHVGDIQFVEAVRRPELAHLINVVVFSCEGERSLPSMLGGGDLDGDIYNLILDPNLFPKHTSAPGSYKPLPHKEKKEECTIVDVADFVIDYIQTDLLGYISILHLRIADLNVKGPACDECMTLAEKASHAVDFPKTGTTVEFSSLPKPDPLKPDYLSWEGTNLDTSKSYYPSKKVLGVLFRRVPMNDHVPRRYDNPTDGDKIYDALKALDLYNLGLPRLQIPTDDLMEEMEQKLWAYCEQLMVIAKTHTISKNAKVHLTEAELVSGTIQAKWADHRKRREAVGAMNLQTQELTTLVRQELREVDSHLREEQGDQDDYYYDDYDEEDWNADARESEIFTRAWAAWNVAEEALKEDPQSFGPQSFGLIALGLMLEVVKECRKVVEGY